MKDIIIFLVLMLLSGVPALVKKVFEEKMKAPPKPKAKPEPYFPDMDVEDPEPVFTTSRTQTQESRDDDYFTYEKMADNPQPNPNIASQQRVQQQPHAAPANAVNPSEEKPKIELSLSEEELYKGIIYSEILKRKYI
ncbi:MAG: hypothetical protein K6A41_06445 [Bacteroidales bacterium]|nr:hypothetical protein [Bacteroidales bacterium]